MHLVQIINTSHTRNRIVITQGHSHIQGLESSRHFELPFQPWQSRKLYRQMTFWFPPFFLTLNVNFNSLVSGKRGDVFNWPLPTNCAHAQRSYQVGSVCRFPKWFHCGRARAFVFVFCETCTAWWQVGFFVILTSWVFWKKTCFRALLMAAVAWSFSPTGDFDDTTLFNIVDVSFWCRTKRWRCMRSVVHYTWPFVASTLLLAIGSNQHPCYGSRKDTLLTTCK